MAEKRKEPYMGSVKVGPKGQVVIPKEVRDMFGIEPGQTLLIMAHPERGIAMERQSVMQGIANAIFSGEGQKLYPNEPEEHLGAFAENIRKTTEDKK